MDKSDTKTHPTSVLLKKIDKFVTTYGVDNLIEYLDDYQSDIALEEFQKYKTIEKVSCEVWELPIADLDTVKQGTVNKNARMCIVFLTYKYTKINRTQLSLMMKAKIRTIDYYLSDIKYRFEHKSMYGVFLKNLELIKEKTNCQ